MKEDLMRRAIGGIDDRLIESAEKERKTDRAKTLWMKWGSVAAAFILVAALGILVLPGIFKNDPPASPSDPSVSGNESGNGSVSEYWFEKGYTYSVDGGKYASYVKGKVIAGQYVGAKLEDVTVTAGWVDADGKSLTEEHAKAEIYEIAGVSTDVAAAIRFIDELEAQTTTQFYVIVNPKADLAPVRPYVIPSSPLEQNDGGNGVPE